VPKGITQDFANGSIAFTSDNIWIVNIVLSLSHNEKNNGRTVELRLYNTVTTLSSNPIRIAIGRNTPGTTYAGSLMVEITSAQLNDPFVFQIGNVLHSNGSAETL